MIDRRSSFGRDVAFGLQVAFLVALTVAASVVAGPIPQRYFWRVLTLAVVVVVTTVALTRAFWRSPLEEALAYRELLSRLPDLVQRVGATFRDVDFAAYEEARGASHITIVTDEPMVAYGGTKVVDADYLTVMKRNVKRGVSYEYVFPDRPEVRERRDRILREFPTGVRVTVLAHDDWERLPLSVGEYVVLESDSSPAEVFVVDNPTAGERTWAPVLGTYATRWVGRTRQVLDSTRQSAPRVVSAPRRRSGRSPR